MSQDLPDDFSYLIDETGTYQGNPAIQIDLDDLEPDVIETLGNYLSDQTIHGHILGPGPNHGNSYVVKGAQIMYSYTGQDGHAVNLTTQGDPDEVFHPDNDAPFMNLYSAGSELASSTPVLGDYLSKGGPPEEGQGTGQELLAGFTSQNGVVTGIDEYGHSIPITVEPDSDNPSPSAQADRAISASLLINRFNPSIQQAFNRDGSRDLDSYLATEQDKFGDFQRTHTDDDKISQQRIIDAATEMMKAASLTLDGVSSDQDVAISPVSLESIRISSQESAPGGAHLESELIGTPGSGFMQGSADSYGTFYTFERLFAQLSGSELKILAGNLCQALAIALANLAADPLSDAVSDPGEYDSGIDQVMTYLNELVPDGEPKPPPPGEDLQLPLMWKIWGLSPEPFASVYSLGQSSHADVEDILQTATDTGKPPYAGFKHIGVSTFVPQAETSYTPIAPDTAGKLPAKEAGLEMSGATLLEAFEAGYEALIMPNFAESSTLSSAIEDTPDGGSPFFLNLCRILYRDISEVARVLTDSTGGERLPDLDAAGIVGFNSRVSRFVKIIAKIGDLSLFQERFTGSRTLSTIDSLPANIRAQSMKSRVITPYGPSLAWRTSALPSMYVMPVTVLAASAMVGWANLDLSPPLGIVALGSQLSPQFAALAPTNILDTLADAIPDPSGISTMILKETSAALRGVAVEAIETQLDAEYMPFYFHDLRTSEVVSFHAFLTSLADNYDVQYNRTNAYGRIDDVQVYSKTKRTISMDFVIVSTNKRDFDQMWWKINKFVNFLYPQWSPGMRVMGTLGPFRQPFSQIPTASPLIRLRLGDLFRSNFSKFALARIFGAGEQMINPLQAAQAVTPLPWPAGSAVARGFKSTAGKGLAGFISNVSFTWLSDEISWETEDFGSRAPKACKISLTFDPIHDIAPGIDSYGFDRAPIYNVGTYANSVGLDVHASGFPNPAARLLFNEKKNAVNEELNKAGITNTKSPSKNWKE